MAKKVVASLQKGGGKEHTKVIKMVKSDKSGSYTFKEEVAEVILWYIYEHSLAEDQEDKIVNFGDEQLVIETSEDLYELICLVEK